MIIFCITVAIFWVENKIKIYWYYAINWVLIANISYLGLKIASIDSNIYQGKCW